MAPHVLQAVNHRELKADSNGIVYDIMVWTPPTYEDTEKDFPLLILLDGCFLMGTAAEAVSVQVTTGEARPIIVVGVSTAAPQDHGLQRSIDYSAEAPSLEVPPSADFSFWRLYEKLFADAGVAFDDGFGGTDLFYAFLVDQLLPQLQQDYRIDPNEIGMGGHSSGGDFAVDTLLRKQTPFSKFIVGSFGADVLAKSLSAREQAFAAMQSPRPLKVFCGYGDVELHDPNMTDYIQSGIDLMQRLQDLDQNNLSVQVRGYEHENHGSVFHHILSSGIRELWGTGMTMTQFMQQIMLADESVN
ncbi:MAG: hypothetical protein AAGF35_12325 [Pseudomonadota bacterium]